MVSKSIFVSTFIVCIFLIWNTEAGEIQNMSFKERFQNAMRPVEDAVEKIEIGMKDLNEKLKQNPMYQKVQDSVNELMESAQNHFNKMYDLLIDCARRCDSVKGKSLMPDSL